MPMSQAQIKVREKRGRKFDRMNELTNVLNERKLTADEASEFDKLEREMRALDLELDAHVRADGAATGAYETRGGGREYRDANFDYENPRAVLESRHSYAKWLAAQPEARSAPHDFDAPKYWRGMVTGNWSGAEAEHRASMQEGVSADGGYLVPSPVAGQFVNILRDRILFMAGAGHTVPWEAGSTLTLPIVTADPEIQNLAETTDAYPPSSDVTVSRYEFTARPYIAVETMSWELLQDSAIPLEDLVTTAMARRLAVNMQSDFIYNSASNKIQGFTNASGLLTSVQGGTSNGAAPTGGSSGTQWDYVNMAIEAVRNAKVEPDLIATSPKAFHTFGQASRTRSVTR